MKHIKSGRKLECYSNQPGVQFYTGNIDFIIKQKLENWFPENSESVFVDSYGKQITYFIQEISYPVTAA